tara:strand:- start:9257 stop:9694 length:438 start_codon:yes stop_codon:yes gene_type:complete
MYFLFKRIALGLISRTIKIIISISNIVYSKTPKTVGGPLSRVSLINVVDKNNNKIQLTEEKEELLRQLKTIDKVSINSAILNNAAVKIEFNFIPDFISKRNKDENAVIETSADKLCILLKCSESFENANAEEIGLSRLSVSDITQ